MPIQTCKRYKKSKFQTLRARRKTKSFYLRYISAKPNYSPKPKFFRPDPRHEGRDNVSNGTENLCISKPNDTVPIQLSETFLRDSNKSETTSTERQHNKPISSTESIPESYDTSVSHQSNDGTKSQPNFQKQQSKSIPYTEPNSKTNSTSSKPNDDLKRPSATYFSYANIQGLKPKTVQSKVPTISDLLHEKEQMFFALSETWLRDHKDAEIQIDGYTIFRADRERKRKKHGRDSGGTAIYVRNEIANTFEPTLRYSNGTIEIISIHSKVEKLHISCVYRQPDDSKGQHKSTSKEFSPALHMLHKTLSSYPNHNKIISGDFNLPHIAWPHAKPSSQATADEKKMTKLLTDFMDSHFLNQYISNPTHKDGNTLDLILTNNDQLIHNISSTEPLRSTTHHFFIEVMTTLCSQTQSISNSINYELLPPLKKLNFHSEKTNWNEITKYLQNINWEEEFNNLEVEEIVKKINTISYEATVNHVPLSTSSNPKKVSHIPRDRKNLMRRRGRITKRLTTLTSPSQRDKLRSELIQIEKSLQKSRKASKTYQERKAINAIKKNSKYFFTYAKKYTTTKNNIGPLRNHNKKFIYENKEMAEILAQQYFSVYNKPDSTLPPAHILFPGNETIFNDITLTEEDFTAAISELSATAGTGPDGFPAILLKNCKEEYSKPLTLLWRKCLDEGITPGSLKRPIIIPKFKDGSKADAENYRPIALTSHIIKIFEKVLRSKLVQYLEENHLFNKNQHGFVKGKSCLSQLLAHYDTILSGLEEGAGVDIVYLDFSKAFDKVDFHILLNKIKKLGIGGKIGRWLYSFLTGRTQSVLVNNTLSAPTDVLSGVPQGSVIGPLLFLILIGDIDKDLAHSKARSFADDTRVSKSIKNVMDASKLQTDLLQIYDWAEINKMSFNEKKFDVLRYRNNDPTQDCTSYTTPSGQVIKEKTTVKDLGILMSNNLSFNSQINHVVTSLRNMSGWILRTFETRESLGLLTTWKQLALPIHDYCSQLYNPYRKEDIQQLENIQWSFIRKIKNIKNKTYWEALKSTHLYSLQRRRERYIIIYLYKILEGITPNIAEPGSSTEIRITGTPADRKGRTLHEPAINTKSNAAIQNARYYSINILGPKIWNRLPKQLRDVTNQPTESFKHILDKYLQAIPDHPHLPQNMYECRALSNSLLHMIPLLSGDIRKGTKQANTVGGAMLSP